MSTVIPGGLAKRKTEKVSSSQLANSSVTSVKIANETIVNADVSPSAAIAGIKISPNFGSQNVTTSGVITGLADGGGSAVFSRADDTTSSYFVQLRKARGSHTTPLIVNDGDLLGGIVWYGHDGTTIRIAATVGAVVDGAPAAGDMPGRLVFSTTPDGTTTPVERVRIGNSGNVGVGTTTLTSRLNVSGDITLTSATTATAATAGTNGAVPAQVAGYLVASINGTSVKIPYFAA